jgi:formate hydrogenlyase transcriptional activator
MRILHLEDDAKDAELIQSILEAAGISCDVTRVDTPTGFHGSLERSAFDLVLADYTLPGFDGISALRVAKEISPDVPFIFVTGTLGEEVAVEALKLGATDFVSKTRLSRMAPAVRRAMRETEERSHRQLAERTLRESETYLAEAQRLSQTGSWAWNLETGDIRYWSEECFRVLGFDPGSPLPKFEEFLPRVHSKDRAFVKQRFEKAVDERADFELDYRLVHPAAGVRDIHCVGHAVLDQSRELVEFVGTVIDVTERNETERELKRSEAFLAEGQRITQTGSFCWSVAIDAIAWSDELYRIFEFDTNLPVTLERITSRVHPDDLVLVQNMIERVRHAADDFEFEHRLLMPDQSIKHIHLFAHAAKNKDGRLEYIGAVQDVTRRRLAEEQLRERELNLRRITQTIPGMLWSATAEGEVDYSNRPWLDFTAMTAEQAKGWGWTAAIHPDDRDSLIEGWRSCLASGTPFDMEARMRRFDGAYRWFLFRANPLRGESGKIVKWYGTSTDIEDRKRREEVLRASEQSWRQIVDNIPGLVATMGATGEVEFLNRQTLEYFGKSHDDLKNWALSDAVHPDDLPRIIQVRIKSIEEGTIYDVEHRCRRADGVYRWFQVRGLPVRDAENTITAWYLLLTDIDDRKRAEEKLQQSEQDLRTITESIPQPIVVLAPDGNTLYVNQRALDITGYTRDQLDERGYWARVVHPDDVNRLRADRQERLLSGVPFELEFRVLYKSGQYRWILMQYNPLKDESGQTIRWYSTATDIDDRKRAEERLRQSEAELRTITDTVRQPIVVFEPDGMLIYANQVALDNSGLTIGELKKGGFLARASHHDDFERAIDERNRGLSKAIPFDSEARILFRDGEYRWQLLQYNPLRDESGRILRWYVTATDIEDRKRNEERLRQEGDELRTITDAIRQPIIVLAPDGTILYANQVACQNSGLSVEELINEGSPGRTCHPDDINRVLDGRRVGLSEGVPFDLEMRLLRGGGQYRWQVMQYNPLKDDSGQIIRWYATATDIDDRKKAEERLRNENLVLREEIDRSSMFEEIVGSCKPMRQVLKQVEKVAATDSTVLILGETGTGKELIARALHRKSKRAARAFIRVNCAAIPQSLIASELFGHEKGAFTGALQRRLGRFEAADGGTLFLDEIGDLPMETQIALLRVLQEKEFERVGSNHPVSVDVRLIAATNRDLPAAVAEGTFRQDLYYRLNVVPINVPPLRERVDDISLLVEYFVGRFAKGAGKNIRHIGKHTLEQLENYHWPGNIRELQNVVERAVVLCETETFVVDESWLKRESADSPRLQDGLSALTDREVEMIETALAESRGRISGPSGAAAKLGIPRQTLESKIRRLGIDRYGQKRPTS